MKLQRLLLIAFGFPATIVIIGNYGERSAATQERRWRLSPEPVVQIGVAFGEPAYEFHRIAGAVRLSNGHIAVANGGSNEVRFYDASGQFMHAVGGEGGGPEEFQLLLRLFLLGGDTVAAFDSRRRRVLKYDENGLFLNAVQLYPAPGIPRVSVRGFFADGSMLGIGQELPSRRFQTGLSTTEYHLISFTPDGSDTKYLGSFSGYGQVTIYMEGHGYSNTPLLFSRNSYFITGSTHFYHIWAGENAINKYSQQGDLLEVFRTDNAPRRITARDVRAAQEAFLARDSTPVGRKYYTAVLEAMPPPPDFHAAFGWPTGEMKATLPLGVDDDNNVWVLNYQVDDGQHLAWSVFDTDGNHITDVATPEFFRPYQFGPDFVLGKVSDEDGVEYVRMYELVKR